MNELREIAIKKYQEKGISYNDITAGDICVLTMILNKNIKAACKSGKMSNSSMYLSEKIKSKYTSAGKLKECDVFINSDYFTRRECISFYRDGTISFCDWADGSNTKVITDSFKEWVETIF